jgi:thymidylate synthase
MRFSSFHEAYPSILESVHWNPEFNNAPRGFQSRERLYAHFTLTNPVERVCYLQSRRTNIVFNFAEALWHLSGSNSLAFIGYYGKNLHQFTMDGETLTGTAYGPRIFAFGVQRINQWERVAQLLSHDDPDSKRATIQIFTGEECLSKDNIDVACTLALQFFVREGKLYSASFMRANDAYRGLVSDLFCFTLMQELMAKELRLEVGDYHHSAASLHTYESDHRNILSVLKEAREQPVCSMTRFSFPCMPSSNNWQAITTLLNYEQMLRTGTLSLSEEEVLGSGLPDYWQQVLRLFGLYQKVVRGERWIDSSLFLQLWPVYRFLFSNRWRSEV